MDANYSIHTTLLTTESLDISPAYFLPVFIFGALTYCAILVFNLILFLTIVLNRKLHKPMYMLLVNLPINDMMGASAFFPQVLNSILLQDRSITYTACFVQAFLSHVYITGSILVLTAMAFDRYVAICCPLRYNTLMSPNNILKLLIIVWTVNFVMIGILLILAYRKELCSTKIVDIFCNNPSLVKLICGDTRVNNIYGLFITSVVQSLCLPFIFFTYTQILIATLSKKQSDAKSKAIQTCATHLVVFLSLEINALFTMISHRFDYVSQYLRRSLGASIMIFPPFFNPLVYGLKTKEIRQSLIFFLSKKS